MKKVKNRFAEPGDPPPEDLVLALTRIFEEQRGSSVLINYRRLRAHGYRGDPVRTNAYLEDVLRNGFPDPLNRGIWRLKRIGRNGNRKKYYAELRHGVSAG
jgi:hypothetical protein